MNDLITLINDFRAKELNFNEFIGGLGAWFNDIGVGGFVTSVLAQAWVPFAALALGMIFLFYGRKWLGCIKFVSCAGIGFVAGLVVNPFLIDMLPFLDGKAWITGALCALMLAVLNKLIFALIFFGIPVAATFIVCYFEGVIPYELPTVGNVTTAAVAAVGALLIMLVIRKDFERIITAIIGGFIINFGVKSLYDYTATIPDIAMQVDLGVVAALAVMGYFYQYRRRRRYY